jgi:hypothetical protein
MGNPKRESEKQLKREPEAKPPIEDDDEPPHWDESARPARKERPTPDEYRTGEPFWAVTYATTLGHGCRSNRWAAPGLEATPL